MNILLGPYKPDQGEVFIKGKKVEVKSPIDTLRTGVGMVHQYFMLISVFTVTENGTLGSENLTFYDFLDRKKRPNGSAKYLESLN